MRTFSIAYELDGRAADYWDMHFDADFNRAYYESVASSRVGPYPIDLMNFEGEEAERMKSLAALAAVAKSLDKLDNKEAREVAADLRVLMKSLDKERAWFDREYSKHYGKPRQPA